MEEKIKTSQVKQEILRTFFSDKSSAPDELKDPFPCNKTTLEIIDTLAPMVKLTEDDVLQYMVNNNFTPCTDADGSVKWRIFEERQG